MFGFNKKKKEKKQNSLDKILMGLVVGGAIGSVLGVGLAPKKGSDTRKDISKKAGKLLNSAKEVVSETANKFVRNPHENSFTDSRDLKKHGVKSIPEEK